MENDITDLGKVAITPQKDYNKSTTYEWLDVVTYDGASYMCISEDGCIGIVPTSTGYWQLLADKGHFTKQDKEEFKQAVVEESKTEITEHTEAKKTELDNYTSDFETSLKNELDTYEIEKEAQLDIHKTTLETEMTNTKDSLVGEIETAQNGFNDNVTAKTTAFNNNATAKTTAFNNNVTQKTNTFNSNAETKTEDFDTNANTKKTEYNNNVTAKIEEYNNNSATKLETYNNNATEKTNSFNSNAETKTAEFNENAETLTNRVKELETEVDELSQQAPWRTTEINDSIHVEDSAKYRRNKLIPFGYMKQQETRAGYNLLNTENLIEQTTNGVTISKNSDGTFNISGTAVAGRNVILVENLSKELSGDYTLIVQLLEGSIANSNARFAIGNSLMTSAATDIGRLLTLVTSTKASVWIASGQINDVLENLQIYINAGMTFNTCKFAITLVKDIYTLDTIPDYEQYGAMPSSEYPSIPQTATGVQKIRRCGKNLFDKDNVDTIAGFLGDGGTINSNSVYSSIIFKCSSNKTYTISKSAGNIFRIAEFKNYPAINATWGNRTKNDNATSITYTTSKTANYIVISFYRSDMDTIDKNTMLASMQIELSDTATDCEPYSGEDITLDLETTELAKIVDANGNVVAQDKAVYRKVDGNLKWQWEKNVLKVVLDGGQTLTKWAKGSASNDDYSVFQNSHTSLLNLAKTDIVICDKFKYETNFSNINKECICLNNGSNYYPRIAISNSRLTEATSDAFKNWIVENNITYYCVATAPEYIDCTPEQSATLDKLYKLQLEKGTNNIFIESENGVTAELQLTYMQDSNLLREQEHKNFEDRITAIEDLLSTTATSAILLDNLQTDLESEVK